METTIKQPIQIDRNPDPDSFGQAAINEANLAAAVARHMDEPYHVNPIPYEWHKKVNDDTDAYIDHSMEIMREALNDPRFNDYIHASAQNGDAASFIWNGDAYTKWFYQSVEEGKDPSFGKWLTREPANDAERDEIRRVYLNYLQKREHNALVRADSPEWQAEVDANKKKFHEYLYALMEAGIITPEQKESKRQVLNTLRVLPGDDIHNELQEVNGHGRVGADYFNTYHIARIYGGDKYENTVLHELTHGSLGSLRDPNGNPITWLDEAVTEWASQEALGLEWQGIHSGEGAYHGYRLMLRAALSYFNQLSDLDVDPRELLKVYALDDPQALVDYQLNDLPHYLPGFSDQYIERPLDFFTARLHTTAQELLHKKLDNNGGVGSQLELYDQAAMILTQEIENYLSSVSALQDSSR